MQYNKEIKREIGRNMLSASQRSQTASRASLAPFKLKIFQAIGGSSPLGGSSPVLFTKGHESKEFVPISRKSTGMLLDRPSMEMGRLGQLPSYDSLKHGCSMYLNTLRTNFYMYYC